MHLLALGLAGLVALAIIAIGTQYVASPRTATRSFGLPLPEEGANVAWWLRLKGVRDIVAGLGILAFMVWGGQRGVGLILLVDAIIAVGDMLVVLAAKGSTRLAFGMHGLTAVVMILAAVTLLGARGDASCSVDLASCRCLLRRRRVQRDRHARNESQLRPLGLSPMVVPSYRRIGHSGRRPGCASCQPHCWPSA